MEVRKKKMSKKFSKFLWSAPGIIMLAMILFLISMLLGRLFGASFFVISSITAGFLICLIIYLCLHIFESKLLKKIRKCLTKTED
jgi:uncharacterized membrane protein YciS (DUF1049 family)